MANSNLTNAKKAKNDEFYTQYNDIQKEIEAYLEYDANVFRDKVVYCNCDDPFESNFFKYFASKFKDYGLKKLITTSFVGSPIVQTQMHFPGENNKELPNRKNRKAFKIEINEIHDLNKDGAINLADIKKLLEHDKNASSCLHSDGKYPAGDFRSKECADLLGQADVVVTNPPFSLFRDYIKQLFDYKKKFLIIGSMNAITYKEIFPLIKENRMWLGNKTSSQQMFLEAPKEYTEKVMACKPEGMWWRVIDGKPLIGIHTALWFTNLDHGRRHQPLQLQTMADNLKFSKHKEIRGKEAYDKYDNYDAIDVPFTDAIPGDYDGVMGVPISFLDKYNPDQFEIVSANDIRVSENIPFKAHGLIKDKEGAINGKPTYVRVLIKHKKK